MLHRPFFFLLREIEQYLRPGYAVSLGGFKSKDKLDMALRLADGKAHSKVVANTPEGKPGSDLANRLILIILLTKPGCQQALFASFLVKKPRASVTSLRLE
jgi:hypothetical protein